MPPPAFDEAYLAQLTESAHGQTAQGHGDPTQPPGGPYVVKNPLPLPEGYISVEIAPLKRYLGKAQFLEESQAIIHNHADILFNAADRGLDEGKVEKIGKIRFHIIQQNYMGNHGIDKFEEMDRASRELSQIYEAFFDEQGEPTLDDLDEAFQGDMLYINSVRLEPKWRGYGIGLLALNGLAGLLPSFEMDIIILSPVGLNREEGYDRTLAKDKLTQYYAKLGFEMWHDKSDTQLPFMGTWTGYVRPDIENVVPHLF
ncbi:hypothetical protein C8R47DRAFT_1163006 [Mycena vitilis]|nr:hypothetical protein C8R47DRAFT_1163006 [Mycena vitilis]